MTNFEETIISSVVALIVAYFAIFISARAYSRLDQR